MLMPNPDVFASSSRAVIPVATDRQFPRVIIQLLVPQNPNIFASSAAAVLERLISPMHSAVVVVVESTRFTFKANSAPVDIARHVVVQMDGVPLANWRVDIRTPKVLNSLDYQKI